MKKFQGKKYYFYKHVSDELLKRAYEKLSKKYNIYVEGYNIYLGVFYQMFEQSLIEDLKKTEEYKLSKMVGDVDYLTFKKSLLQQADVLVKKLTDKNLKVPQLVSKTVNSLKTLSLEHSDILELYQIILALTEKVENIIEKDNQSKIFDTGITLSVIKTLLNGRY